MPGATSPDGITYPVVGDKMSPLATWFAGLATTTQAAIANLRDSLEEPELPNPITVAGATVQTISATAWADLPNASPITLELERACWVQITHYGWMASSNGDARGSSRVSGATTLGENQAEIGGPATVWGLVMYATGGGTRQQMGTRTVRLNAGTNTIQLRAYRTGGTTANNQMNYSALQVTPLRWA